MVHWDGEQMPRLFSKMQDTGYDRVFHGLQRSALTLFHVGFRDLWKANHEGYGEYWYCNVWGTV